MRMVEKRALKEGEEKKQAGGGKKLNFHLNMKDSINCQS